MVMGECKGVREGVITFRGCDRPRGGVMLENCISLWRGVILMVELYKSFGRCDSYPET